MLASGPGAVLSHETAAELIGLLPEPAPAIHVSVPLARRVIRRRGVVVYRSSYVDVARHPVRQPPQTRVEHTVVDLARRSTDPETAVAWLVRAVGARLTTAARLLAVIRGMRRVRWRNDLVGALADVAEGCQSILELRYLRLVERAHRLPSAVRQRRRGPWYDDVAYVDHGVCVELDGRVAHPAASAFRDHRRDNTATLSGARVLRYGYGDVTRRPCTVAGEVATALRAAGWSGAPRSCGPRCAMTVEDPPWPGPEISPP